MNKALLLFFSITCAMNCLAFIPSVLSNGSRQDPHQGNQTLTLTHEVNGILVTATLRVNPNNPNSERFIRAVFPSLATIIAQRGQDQVTLQLMANENLLREYYALEEPEEEDDDNAAEAPTQEARWRCTIL